MAARSIMALCGTEGADAEVGALLVVEFLRTFKAIAKGLSGGGKKP